MRRVVPAILALSLFAHGTLVSGGASAQSGAAHAVYVVVGDGEEARARTAPRAEAWLRDRGFTPRQLTEAMPEREPLGEHELAPLMAAEKDLVAARALAARFAEAEALGLLTRAEQTLLGALALPFAHALLAEVYVQTAIVAAALSEPGLTDTALRKAATLDPLRSLQAAEAPPDVLARARAIERERDSTTRARARVTSEPEGAEVWLDGELLGRAPLELSSAPGSHVLVMRHPEATSYAALIELGAGARSPIHVVLAPTRAAEAQRALRAAADEPVRVAALAQAATGAATVWLFALQPEDGSVAVLACRAGACERAARLAPAREPTRRARVHQMERAPVWKRWPFWLGVSLTALAGAAVTAWALADEPTREERVLTIDPGALPD